MKTNMLRKTNRLLFFAQGQICRLKQGSSLLSNLRSALFPWPQSLSGTQYFAWYSTFPMQVSLLPLSPSPCETRQKMLKDWRMAKPELGRFDNFWRGLRSLHSRLTTCKILPSSLARKLWIHATAERLLVIATDCFNTRLRSCTGGKRELGKYKW